MSYSGQQTFTYQVSSPTLEIALSTLSYSSYCSNPLDRTFTYTAKTNDGADLPDFIGFDSASKQISVETNDKTKVGTY